MPELELSCPFSPPSGLKLTVLDLGPHLSPIVADPYLLDTAVAAVRNASLLQRHTDRDTLTIHLQGFSGLITCVTKQRHTDRDTLTIHRLVQVVIQGTMDEGTKRLWAERAVRVVHGMCKDLDQL